MKVNRLKFAVKVFLHAETLRPAFLMDCNILVKFKDCEVRKKPQQHFSGQSAVPVVGAISIEGCTCFLGEGRRCLGKVAIQIKVHLHISYLQSDT